MACDIKCGNVSIDTANGSKELSLRIEYVDDDSLLDAIFDENLVPQMLDRIGVAEAINHFGLTLAED